MVAHAARDSNALRERVVGASVNRDAGAVFTPEARAGQVGRPMLSTDFFRSQPIRQ